jgi:hypothetical protein
VTAGVGLSFVDAPATSGANMNIRPSQPMNLRRSSWEDCVMASTKTFDGLKDRYQDIAARA